MAIEDDDPCTKAEAVAPTPETDIEALRESEGRHRALFEAIADGVFVAQDYRFVFANAALPQMLGRDRATFTDIPFAAVIAPEDLDIWTERFEARVGSGPEPVPHYGVRLLHANGERLDAELSARRIVYHGRPGVLGVLRDVTERRNAETTLRESEMRYRTLVDAVSAVTWRCPSSGLHVAPQPDWMAFTGQSAEEMLGDGWMRAVHPDDLAATATRWVNAVARGAPFEGEARYRRRDGVWRWMNVRAAPVRDRDGAVIEWFGMNIDITERKDADAALRASEERFRKVFQSAATGIAISALDGRIEQCNPAFCALLGYSEAELRAIHFLSIVHPADRCANMTEAARVLAGEIKDSEHESRYLRKDGATVWVRKYISVLTGEAGEPARIIALVTDMTARRRAEAELRDLNATLEMHVAERTGELREANAELESFAYAVSHDLRAPLRAMSGFSRTLIEECSGKLTQNERHNLLEIDSAAQAMGRLINAILALSRTSMTQLQKRQTDISVIATRISQTLAAAEPERRVDVSIEPGLRAVCDPDLIGVVMTNLLGNAWKFSAGAEGARIRVYRGVVDEVAGVCVSDNGAGFDPAHANRLFKPFQRLHRQDEFEGLGVGLATVQRIVTRHGGRIAWESRPGRGATFCFELPGNDPKDPVR